MERYLKVSVAGINQRSISVVCRHPWVVPTNVDLWSGAVKPILSVETNLIRDLGFRLRSIWVVLSVCICLHGILIQTVLTDVKAQILVLLVAYLSHSF